MTKSAWFTLAVSGLFFGAERFAEAHGAGTPLGAIVPGGAVAASVIGSYLNNLAAARADHKLTEAERLALASKNHHLRRSTVRALRRALAVARAQIPGLAPIYDSLFDTWDRTLGEGESDNNVLEQVLPPQLAEPHWNAVNSYRTDIEADSNALASLLREWLRVDL